MRKANVTIIEMNTQKQKQLTNLAFETVEELNQKIDDYIYEYLMNDNNIKGEKVSSYNFEITVDDDGQFSEEDLNWLEETGCVIGY